MFDLNLNGKVAIITGASSGIGLATVKVLLASSAHVFGVDIVPIKDQELSKLAEDKSSNFHFHKCNLTEPSAAKTIVATCKGRFGDRIDILANVAGIMDHFESAENVSEEMLDRVLVVNLKAPVKLMGAVLPTMLEQKKGSIVNIASIAGVSGAAAGIAYTTSKHGLVSISDTPTTQRADISL